MEAEKLKLLSKLKKQNEAVLTEISRADAVLKRKGVDWGDYLLHVLVIVFAVCFVFKSARTER